MNVACVHGHWWLSGLAIIGFLAAAAGAPAQQTNKPPRRVFRYTGRIQFMERAAELTSPVKTDEDAEVPENKKISALPKSTDTWRPPLQPAPPRRINLKKDQGIEKPPWILQPEMAGETNAQPAKVSGWGWLADEIEVVRKYSDPIIKGPEEANSWSNVVMSATETNAPGRARGGLVVDYTYQPALPLVAASAGVERVVSDQGLDELKKKQPEKQSRAETQKQGADLSGHRDQFAGLVNTNETLGLARSKTEDQPPEEPGYQQTRSLLSEIVKPYTTDWAGGEASKTTPALQPGSPGMAPSQSAGDALKAAAYRRMLPGADEQVSPGGASVFSSFRPAGLGNPAAVPPPARHNAFETARPFDSSRSSARPTGAGWSTPHGLAPGGFTPTSLYSSPLDVNRPSDTGH
ncbi:MAG: hypothetical protein NTV49_16435 [Kiritimatiellaeota bacterium]|nr:hypothetical protein [Kiritimatiellota bacterium]